MGKREIKVVLNEEELKVSRAALKDIYHILDNLDVRKSCNIVKKTTEGNLSTYVVSLEKTKRVLREVKEKLQVFSLRNEQGDH